MKQYRDTNYYVTKNGEVFRHRSSYVWKSSKPYMSRNGKFYSQTKTIPSLTKKLKPQKHNQGYKMVALYFGDGKLSRKYTLIHRMVAECYLGPCPAGYEVDHIDGDKTNNHISNLQYLTKEENLAKRVYSS